MFSSLGLIYTPLGRGLSAPYPSLSFVPLAHRPLTLPHSQTALLDLYDALSSANGLIPYLYNMAGQVGWPHAFFFWISHPHSPEFMPEASSRPMTVFLKLTYLTAAAGFFAGLLRYDLLPTLLGWVSSPVLPHGHARQCLERLHLDADSGEWLGKSAGMWWSECL